MFFSLGTNVLDCYVKTKSFYEVKVLKKYKLLHFELFLQISVF